ncbi:hypothetical protein N7492_001359 [Penicillium capsulatum]|uniref:Uncharacterized protein n=1 Tax=Penicillium capsulatum TaxID=69766 RepID=A0A9W9LZM6_9EURO|nr:hypothetical protein N7492_001359 [Penicillium capsulatum]
MYPRSKTLLPGRRQDAPSAGPGPTPRGPTAPDAPDAPDAANAHDNLLRWPLRAGWVPCVPCLQAVADPATPWMGAVGRVINGQFRACLRVGPSPRTWIGICQVCLANHEACDPLHSSLYNDIETIFEWWYLHEIPCVANTREAPRFAVLKDLIREVLERQDEILSDEGRNI